MQPHKTSPVAVIDYSHMGRKITGIERISADLFSAKALDGMDVLHTPEASALGMIRQQWLNIPRLAWKHKQAKLLFPGFPPSILTSVLFRDRVVPYIHDLFLLERVDELNIRARLYMRPSFIYAIRTLPQFFVNSVTTESALRRECKPHAQIMTLRPRAENVFGFTERLRAIPEPGRPIKIVMLGTLEPRKNYEFAAQVTAEVARTTGRQIELHISGREGWGGVASKLAPYPHVRYHGYLSVQEVRTLVDDSDLFMCTSMDEGLGLPLLETLYSGIPMVVSDIPVFKEVCSAASTAFISNTNVVTASKQLIDTLAKPEFFAQSVAKAREATAEWNRLADADLRNFHSFIATPAANLAATRS